ncbi:MAG: hypothetical protein ACK6DM_10210 [Alphaproteobacteria bacterium]|jgi:hypothetical protein
MSSPARPANSPFRTTGHQGQSTRLTPVVSPVNLAGPYDPSQSPEFKEARIAVGIAFERVGWLVPKEKVGGMLIIIDDDRMVLLEASAASPRDGQPAISGALQEPLGGVAWT